MVEPIRKLPPEQLAQIAYEDATPDDQLTPEELRRKTDRAKQRVHRENKKAEKAAATAKAKRAEFDALCESFPDHQTFWQHQRSRLTEAERANYEFLHQQSTDTSFAMLDYLAGTDGTSAEERAEFISDVSKMNADLVPTELLAVPEFWKPAQRQLFARISNRSETARVFCNYGYHLGVMNHVYVQFVAKFIPPPPQVELEKFTTVDCASCKTLASRMSVPQWWLDEMNRKQIVFKCHPCVLAEKNLLAGRQFEAPNKPSIYDRYGRVKMDGE